MVNQLFKNIDTQKQISELDKIIDKINSELYDEKIWINKEMRKIPEVTYSYNKKQKLNGKEVYINTTLFESLGGLNLSNFESLTDKEKIEEIGNANDKLVEKIEAKKEKINQVLKELENIKTDNQNETYKKEIIKNSLQEKLNLLDYCLNGLSYELEKAGIEQYFTYEEIKKIDAKQEILDNILFGGQVSDNPSEVDYSLQTVYKEYKQKKDKLTPEEQERFEYFLNKAGIDIQDFEVKESFKPENLLDKFKEKIDRETYVKILQNSSDLTEKNKFKVYVDENIGSISDGPTSLGIPGKDDYAEKDEKQVLLRIMHEIFTHHISEYNNQNILGNIRGAGSIEKDEGLAIFMENILQFGNQLLKKDEKTGKFIYDVEKFKYPVALPSIFMGEVLTNDEFKEYNELRGKMGIIKDPITIYLRRKRSNKEGVQHKDTSYYRGFFKIIEELNKYILSDGAEGTEFYDLFLGKVSIDDITKLKEINENSENPIKPKRPLWIADLYIYKTECKEENKEFKKEEFITYLQEKYPLIKIHIEDINEMLTKETEALIEKTIEKTRAKVAEIVQKNS